MQTHVYAVLQSFCLTLFSPLDWLKRKTPLSVISGDSLSLFFSLSFFLLLFVS